MKSPIDETAFSVTEICNPIYRKTELKHLGLKLELKQDK